MHRKCVVLLPQTWSGLSLSTGNVTTINWDLSKQDLCFFQEQPVLCSWEAILTAGSVFLPLHSYLLSLPQPHVWWGHLWPNMVELIFNCKAFKSWINQLLIYSYKADEIICLSVCLHSNKTDRVSLFSVGNRWLGDHFTHCWQHRCWTLLK